MLAAAATCAALLLVAPGAGAKADSRCMPRVTPSSVSYSCWGAYPEGFSFTGFATSPYSIRWSVKCGGKTVAGKPKTYDGVVHVYAGAQSLAADGIRAYRLMIASDLCKASLVARRVAGNGSITAEFFINQNHPAPAHN
jgi:hypothetical protein